MNIEFTKAKNSELTFTLNSIFFHSSYSPSKEAQRFCDNLKILNGTKSLILIEPGLNYCYSFLKEKYPNLQIGIIRIIDELKNDNSKWDFVINFINKEGFYNSLINLSEEQLLNSQLVNWPVSENFFKNEINDIWHEYKNALEYAKTILITRQYFEKKWLLNSVKFFSNTNKIYKVLPFSNNTVIAASGPSLKKSIKVLQENRKKYILIALSSAIKPLLSNNLIPDLCISTDGGYWAKQHLKQLTINKNIPLAISSESSVYTKILKQNPIIPLNYEDGISNELFNFLDFKYVNAKRNGTVSGTALDLIKNLTTENIFFCGLDLKQISGYSHTQPNELEINNSIFDNRIKTKEKRISTQGFSNYSLDIYRNWFSQQKNVSKIYRVIDDKNNAELGNIKNISTEKLNILLNEKTQEKSEIIKKEIELSENDFIKIKNQILKYIKEKSSTEKWKKQLFPLDIFSINHAESQERIDNLTKKLEQKNEDLINKIQEMLNAK